MVEQSRRSKGTRPYSRAARSACRREPWRLKSIGEGLHELRIDWGPGYRLYYGKIETACVLPCAEETNANSLRISRKRGRTGRTTRKGRRWNERKPSVSHDEAMAKELRENPEFAVEYLRAAFEEGDDPQILLIALRRIAESRGGVAKMRKRPALSGRAFTARCRPEGTHGSRRWLL